MAAFSGTLRTNEVYSALFNMILAQQVFMDNFGKHQTLVEKAKQEAGLFGDTKLFYSGDVLKSKVWTGHDSEAANLLNVERAPAPACQAIVIDQFRIIALSTDEYLSKRAWSSESAFSDFTSLLIDMMSQTKKVYEGVLFNTYVGTHTTSIGEQMQSIDLTTALTGLSGVEKDKKEAMVIAQALADLMVEMNDYNRSYNDYGYLRSYADEDIKVIWNSKYLNKIRKVDLPTIFHKEGLVDKMESEVLPARYFGTVLDASSIATYSASTPAAGKPIDSDDSSYVPGSNHANGCVRSLVEKEVTVSGTDYHVFPGDEIPSGSTVKASGTFELGETYIEQDDIICKVVTKLPVMLTAFEASVSFYNPRALLTNRYMIWGFSKPEALSNYPFITIKAI